MRGLILGIPVALLLWALLFWAAWPLIGRPQARCRSDPAARGVGAMTGLDEQIEAQTFRAFVALFVIECAYLVVCGLFA